jgi:hypothetical protein
MCMILRSWLGSFTTGDTETHPWLAVQAGWICALSGRPVEAARWADIAERGTADGPLAHRNERAHRTRGSRTGVLWDAE